MKIAIVILFVLAFPTVSNAQWADPGGTWNVSVHVGELPGSGEAYESSDGLSGMAQLGREESKDARTVPLSYVSPVGNLESKEAITTVSDVIRPPNPCNQFDPICNGYPPGTVIIPPPRPEFCNPYNYNDPCNNYPLLPPGTIVQAPQRPEIPCNKFTADRHCPGGVFVPQ